MKKNCPEPCVSRQFPAPTGRAVRVFLRAREGRRWGLSKDENTAAFVSRGDPGCADSSQLHVDVRGGAAAARGSQRSTMGATQLTNRELREPASSSRAWAKGGTTETIDRRIKGERRAQGRIRGGGGGGGGGGGHGPVLEEDSTEMHCQGKQGHGASRGPTASSAFRGALPPARPRRAPRGDCGFGFPCVPGVAALKTPPGIGNHDSGAGPHHPKRL